MCNQMLRSFSLFFLAFCLMYLLFNTGLYIQQVVKKPKMMKQLQNKSVDILHFAGGSVPSVASKMSIICNPNKFTKMLGGRERGRKSKTLQVVWGNYRTDLYQEPAPILVTLIFLPLKVFLYMYIWCRALLVNHVWEVLALGHYLKTRLCSHFSNLCYQRFTVCINDSDVYH